MERGVGARHYSDVCGNISATWVRSRRGSLASDGASDNVAGSHVLLLSVPGQRVEVSGWHSTLSAVFHRDSRQAKALLAELEPSTRDIRLAHLLAAQFVGKNEPTLIATFELTSDGDLSSAIARTPDIERWGDSILPARLRDNPASAQSLEAFLRTRYEELASSPAAKASGNAPTRPWASLWSALRDKYMIAATEAGLVRIDWNEESTLYLRKTQSAGFLVVLRERLHRIRTQAS